MTRTVHRLASSTDQVFRFTVPHAAAMLTADFAYPGSPSSFSDLAISLVNPSGQLIAYSLPQGTGNHGQVEVPNPAAGRWEADISSFGLYAGPVYVQVATAPMVSFGTVSPDHLRLTPGGSARVTLRSLVSVRHGTGHFHGTLTGGTGAASCPPIRCSATSTSRPGSGR